MELDQVQAVVERLYGQVDRERGVPATVAWLCEELGELAQAVRKGTREQQLHELGDVLAWLATIANVAGIDLEQAVQEKYGRGCPGCGAMVCVCGAEEKP